MRQIGLRTTSTAGRSGTLRANSKWDSHPLEYWYAGEPLSTSWPNIWPPIEAFESSRCPLPRGRAKKLLARPNESRLICRMMPRSDSKVPLRDPSGDGNSGLDRSARKPARNSPNSVWRLPSGQELVAFVLSGGLTTGALLPAWGERRALAYIPVASNQGRGTR
jgi:hypothetical protein